MRRVLKNGYGRPALGLGKLIVAGMITVGISAPATAQQAGGFAVEVPGIDHFAGLVLGALPDYLGSDDYTIGAAPVGKYKFRKSERYLKLVATTLSLNLVDSESWTFGPTLNYRPGRQDVDDVVVDRFADIDDTVEFGLMGGWSWLGKDDPRHRFNLGLEFLQDVGDVHKGNLLTASARYWVPVSRAVTLSLGVSTTYADKDYMSTYFDVSAADSNASGLPQFFAGGGIRDFKISPVAIYSLSRKWHLVAGLVYRRLSGDAEDSPIVATRGTADQLLGGIGFAYTW